MISTARYVLVATEEISSMDIFDADPTDAMDQKRSLKYSILQFILRHFNVDLSEWYNDSHLKLVVIKVKRFIGSLDFFCTATNSLHFKVLLSLGEKSID